MTDKEKLNHLIDKLKAVVPYVASTLSPGNTFKIQNRPEWIEVHSGRAQSSYQQLQSLMRLLEEYNKD